MARNIRDLLDFLADIQDMFWPVDHCLIQLYCLKDSLRHYTPFSKQYIGTKMFGKSLLPYCVQIRVQRSHLGMFLWLGVTAFYFNTSWWLWLICAWYRLNGWHSVRPVCMISHCFWTESWMSVLIVNFHIAADPTVWHPGFNLPRQQWSLLKSFPYCTAGPLWRL